MSKTFVQRFLSCIALCVRLIVRVACLSRSWFVTLYARRVKYPFFLLLISALIGLKFEGQG